HTHTHIKHTHTHTGPNLLFVHTGAYPTGQGHIQAMGSDRFTALFSASVCALLCVLVCWVCVCESIRGHCSNRIQQQVTSFTTRCRQKTPHPRHAFSAPGM